MLSFDSRVPCTIGQAEPSRTHWGCCGSSARAAAADGAAAAVAGMVWFGVAVLGEEGGRRLMRRGAMVMR